MNERIQVTTCILNTDGYSPKAYHDELIEGRNLDPKDIYAEVVMYMNSVVHPEKKHLYSIERIQSWLKDAIEIYPHLTEAENEHEEMCIIAQVPLQENWYEQYELDYIRTFPKGETHA